MTTKPTNISRQNCADNFYVKGNTFPLKKQVLSVRTQYFCRSRRIRYLQTKCAGETEKFELT